MTAPLISARSLALGYGRDRVLRDVDLTIAPEQFWFLLGPNGAGKTTFLRALLGQIGPAAGELRRDMERMHPSRLGFVPQRCELNPALPTTVHEFVSLGLVGLALERAEALERLREALMLVGLAGLEDADYWSLSGGQRQRVLVARALARRPATLVLDEPTGGLDLAASHAMLERLDHLHRESRLTILFVTHELALAARHATHVALFHDGTAEAGPARELLTEERLSRAYRVPVRVSPDGAIGMHPVGTP